MCERGSMVQRRLTIDKVNLPLNFCLGRGYFITKNKFARGILIVTKNAETCGLPLYLARRLIERDFSFFPIALYFNAHGPRRLGTNEKRRRMFSDSRNSYCGMYPVDRHIKLPKTANDLVRESANTMEPEINQDSQSSLVYPKTARRLVHNYYSIRSAPSLKGNE